MRSRTPALSRKSCGKPSGGAPVVRGGGGRRGGASDGGAGAPVPPPCCGPDPRWTRSRGSPPGTGTPPEPGIDGVLLLPHLAMRPYLLLCQHRNERVCGYPVREEDLAARPGRDLTTTLLRVLGALHDEQRPEIVTVLAVGPATLHELADRLGLAKSTVHHHMGRLRLGGLVTLTRNPDRSYSYALRWPGLPALLDELVSAATARVTTSVPGVTPSVPG